MCKKTSALSLLSKIESINLYLKLIEQLNKDFQLAGIEYSFDSSSSPSELIHELQKNVVILITHDFDDYLNLLYCVDISENGIKKLEGADLEKMSGQVVYLILKREWQKVWFKNKL